MSKPKIESICHRVSLQSVSTSVGDGGRKVKNYSPIATIWAAIEPSQQSAQFRGGQTQFGVSHLVTTRYDAAYEGARRIIFGVRVFEVRSMINIDEKNQYLLFQCEEISNN